MEINKIQLNTIGGGDNQQGGNTGGGGSSIEYLDVSGLDSSLVSALFGFAILVKHNGIILPAFTFHQVTTSTNASGMAIDFTIEVKATSLGIDGRIGDIFASQGIDISSIPRITKEQFYSLD